MEYYLYKGEDELVHWGIKGMKWGIRRYQNKDGSLTPAGKKHRAAEEAKLKERERVIAGKEKARARRAKLDAKKAELDARERALRKPSKTKQVQEPEKPKVKTARDMSDDEVRSAINRMKLEKEYYDTRKSLAAANPVKVSAGKRFVESLVNDVVVPAAKDAGKAWMTKFMKDKLGLNDKDPMSQLKKEAEKLRLNKEIAEYKSTIKKLSEGGDGYPEVKSWDDMTKKQTWDKARREQQKAERNQEYTEQLERIEREIQLLTKRKKLEQLRNGNANS